MWKRCAADYFTHKLGSLCYFGRFANRPYKTIMGKMPMPRIPQNVNYAVKSVFVMPFIENIPEIKQAAKTAYNDRAEIIEQMRGTD